VRVLGRAFVVLFGLLLAIPAGLLALAIGIALEPAAQDLLATLGLAGFDAIYFEIWRGGAPDLVAADLVVGAWALSTTLLVLPSALVALIGEGVGTRSFVWYGFACGALTAALPWLGRGHDDLPEITAVSAAEGRLTALLFLTGAAAGLTYWLVAGRSAVRPRPT
jgi:hypothetical protein